MKDKMIFSRQKRHEQKRRKLSTAVAGVLILFAVLLVIYLTTSSVSAFETEEETSPATAEEVLSHAGDTDAGAGDLGEAGGDVVGGAGAGANTGAEEPPFLEDLPGENTAPPKEALPEEESTLPGANEESLGGDSVEGTGEEEPNEDNPNTPDNSQTPSEETSLPGDSLAPEEPLVKEENAADESTSLNSSEASGGGSEAGESEEDLEPLDEAREESEEDAGEPGEDYLPAWALLGQRQLRANLALAEEALLLEEELIKRVDAVKESIIDAHQIEVVYGEDNLLQVCAVFALRHDMLEDFPYQVTLASTESKEELHELFREMTPLEVTTSRTEERLTYTIEVKRAGYEDLEDLSAGEKDFLTAFLSVFASKDIKEHYENSILATLTKEEFSRIEELIPAEVHGQARSVLLSALSLEGKVNYFWGGKSHYVGWDARWGQMRTIVSSGIEAEGSAEPFGLDCSGFITWAFINAEGDSGVVPYIGHGTSTQWANSRAIAWSEAKPGDLVFLGTPERTGALNHIGIVLNVDETGPTKVIHCSGASDNVVVTGTEGFNYVRRPYLYGA